MGVINERDPAGREPVGRGRSLAWVIAAYIVGGIAAVTAGWLVRGWHPLAVAAVADVVGTVVVFAFSVLLDNSSVYDPYWSVAPVPLAVYFIAVAPPEASGARQGLVLALVCLWAVRLTWNWTRGWKGIHHEDWRYVDIRRATGRLYWPASFLSIHLLPTVMVFGGCLSVWAACTAPAPGLGALDAVAAAVTLGAIWVEATADRQLRRFVTSGPERGAILDTGLWRMSRHPNYFGEITFWWGLYLFAVAAAPALAWIVVGPAAITLLFVFISLPLIDRRMIRRRAGYSERIARVSAIVPWRPRPGAR